MARKRTPLREVELREHIHRGDVTAPVVARSREAADEHDEWLTKKSQHAKHMSAAWLDEVDVLLENTEDHRDCRSSWHRFKTLATVPPATYSVLVDDASGEWLAVLYRASVLRARLRGPDGDGLFSTDAPPESWERHTMHWSDVVRVALIIHRLLERGELLPETTAQVVREGGVVRLRFDDVRASEGVEVALRRSET